MSMDSDSKKHLEDAKAGQGRNFVMLCSGDKILSLVVYKTGSIDQYKKKAKEAGSGKLYHGEIKGKGNNLIFELARANGFKEEPVGEPKLKKYIADEAELTLAPSFSIVDEHGKPPVAPPPPEKGGATAADKSTTDKPAEKSLEASKKPEAPKVDPAVKKTLVDTLNKLAPLVKAAVQIAPERKTEVLKAYDRLNKGINGDKPTDFRDELVKYGALLKEITSPKSGGGQDDQAARKWSEAAKKWEVNRDAQMAAIKDTMNTLGNLALDQELDSKQVNALISELSDYVPAFEKLTDALDDALEDVEVAADQNARSAAVKSVSTAITNLRKFYTAPRIQKLLADFDGKNFFAPTEESLDTMSKLAG